ncbi:MAG: hypothetical protein K8F27_14210 [Sulfuricellaceae bacterium]|nr:hypothetical protein [Sulfuricellaceae bacterium]
MYTKQFLALSAASAALDTLHPLRVHAEAVIPKPLRRCLGVYPRMYAATMPGPS